MLIDVQTRRQLDASRQLANLVAELDTWKTAAETYLPQHTSQIGSAHRTLATVLQKLTLNNPPLDPEKYKRLILSAHRVWDFFQTKFAQRRSGGSEKFLEVADQFAYDCYQPAAAYVKKAPPLVILTGASLPYVQKRDSPFFVESVATQEALAADAGAATASLPFPVLGLPWSQSAQLEGLVEIGHEVGHAVEDDLELTAQLTAVFTNSVNPARADDWGRWRRELFADIWGCLSAGPSFAYGLADYLAPVQSWKEPIDPTRIYPPDWLRIHFVHQAVARILAPTPLPFAVANAFAEWELVFPYAEEYQGYLDDIPTLLAALFDAVFPVIQKLGSTYTFRAADHDAAERLARTWIPHAPGEARPFPPEERRMRIVVAAVRLAYESAPGDHAKDHQMTTLLKAVTRDRRASLSGQTQADTARGNKLFELFSKA